MKLNRRSFCQGLGAGLLGASLAPGQARGQSVRVMPMLKETSEAVYVQGLPRGASAEQILQAVRRSAEAATDFSWLSKGDTVLLKPAANSKNPYPATTSPLAVAALAKLLKEKGAGKVILCDKAGVQSVYQTPDRVRGSTRQCFLNNGLHPAALDSGAEALYFEETPYDSFFSDTPPVGSHWKNGIWMPGIIQQADHIVLLPRVSRHVLAGSTLALKMAIGWLRDDSRLELHRDAATFYQKIAEIHHLPSIQKRLRLTLTVATQVLAAFGPDFGTVAEPDPGLVFASTSLVAHDLVSLSWLLWCREHAVPKSALGFARDPYQTFPGAMNRAFVGTIWGLSEMLHSQTFDPVRLRTVWDDPVLRRALEIENGAPRLDLQILDQSVSETVQEQINAYLLAP
jgi:uncharacterized protein (DUF362 family)